MRKLIKWIGILLGLCVVVGVIAAISNGGKSPTTATAPAVDQAATAAFQQWLTTTVCAPGTASDPQLPWCSRITTYEVAANTLTVRTTLTKADKSLIEDMLARLNGFAGNNLFKQYGIKKVAIASDTESAVLAPAPGITPRLMP
jgi:hypothetical protein